ncbi:MAG TPA: general stress protein [Candidatus Lumbricidophila sp.]|nr:general stress protein [Candidatus Lumbricidophila sp.]
MSNQTPMFGRRGNTPPTLPKGDPVASYATYAEAQAAVDQLAKADFPLASLAIVGTDLRSVERITGKLTWGRAAGGGALSGAYFGGFMALLLFLFSPTGVGVGLLGSAVLIGAGFGMIFGIVSYSMVRRRRDFTSVMQVIATRYAIIAEPSVAVRAQQMLGGQTVVTPWVTPPSAPPAESPASADTVEPTPTTDTSAAPDVPSEPDASTAVPASDPQPRTYGEALDAAKRAAREAERGSA